MRFTYGKPGNLQRPYCCDDFYRLAYRFVRKQIFFAGKGTSRLISVWDDRRNIARYMRVQQLEEPLKERLDDRTLPLVAAVDLSYLFDKEQKPVSGLAEQGKIKLDAKTAKCVRGMAGNVTEKRVLEALDGGKGKKIVAGKSIKLSADVYEKYFAGVKSAEVQRLWRKRWRHGSGKDGMQVFRTEEIEKLDKSYFNIILAENYDVTIQSKNMGHIWYTHNPEYPGKGGVHYFP